MNKLSIKKLLPGIISITIIAGMAIQSFATNVDMAAFVNKDKYMTKYYELDWRIDAIEKKLISLYQFTCTNVRTYAGAFAYNSRQNEVLRAYSLAYNSSQVNFTRLTLLSMIPSLKYEGYLRANFTNALNFDWNVIDPNHTQKYKKTIPASLCKWMDGIEPAENCTLDIEISYTYKTVGSFDGFNKMESVLIMGPFKKFKYPSAAGIDFLWIPAYLGIPGRLGYLTYNPTSYPEHLQYAENTLTKPTTWKNLPSTVNSRPYLNESAPRGTFPGVDYDNYSDVAFSPEEGAEGDVYMNWQGALPTTSLEGKKNIWLKFYYTNASSSGNVLSESIYTGTTAIITSWNNNK